jgi:hypothetical protein
MNRKLTSSRKRHENVLPEVTMTKRGATLCARGAAFVIGVFFGQIVTLGAAINRPFTVHELRSFPSRQEFRAWLVKRQRIKLLER